MSGTFGIFGLWVRCDCALPGIAAPAPGSHPDVQVVLDAWPADAVHLPAEPWYVSSHRDERGRPVLTVHRSQDGRWFRWTYIDGMRFLIEDARTVWCCWPDTLSPQDALTYLLGPVMGFLLVQRGMVCLHGGAVEVDGGAVLLVGPAGSGKSTTTAALSARGIRVISEDIAALQRAGQHVMVLPGPQEVRLWPASVRMLYGHEDALPALTPTWDKRVLDGRGGARFCDEPRPLKAIYLLDERRPEPSRPRVEHIAGSQAMLDLAGNVYGTLMRQPEHRADEFAMLARLCAQVPIRSLRPHADPSRLPDVCRYILDDVAAMPCIPAQTQVACA